ncbi:MAG: Sec-independent protein secretion pathway component [Candidatus Dadabacteria bacterium CSP1-2]|jgi:sec-independent protein translocase protein TatB|nr:MAG: Sec-independent protein secretion pathway component [Candidatus Dadabacteria bacterium CSP1-2]MBF8302474.1 twin-arginine translocation protein TatB [Candidatus Dadabacteria bacterium]
MFGIGTSEILIILLIALIILGPKEIPKIARTLGRTMREFQRATDELKHTIDSEIEIDEEVTDKKPQENTVEEKKIADS